MGFIRNRFQTNEVKNSYTLASKELLSLLGLDTSTINTDKLGEVVFFTCLNFLSNSVSKLNIYQYSFNSVKGKERIIDNGFQNVLNLEPNEYMSAATFWSCVELNRNFYGNAYVYISRTKNKGNLESLWILDSDNVTVWRDTAGLFGRQNAMWYIWYDPNNAGKKYTFSSSEILHFKTSTTWDGVMGISVKDILKQQIETQKYGQGYINNLYKNNMFGDKVLLQYTGELSPTLKDTLVKETERYCNTNGTRFLPLPMGITATTLSMKLSDAEFSMINNTNALRLCAAFQLSPNVINDYSKSSYANSISQKVDFYTDALSPILNMYKQENTRKLLSSKDKSNGTLLEHDIRSLFKLDPIAQMDYFQKGCNNFLITPNEAREELGYSWVDGGDILLGNGNLATLDVIKSGVNYKKNTDNKGGDDVGGK